MGLYRFYSAPERVGNSLTQGKEMCADNPRKEICWAEFLAGKIAETSPNEGFLILKQLYSEESDIRPFCHQIALHIGEEVYKKIPDPDKLHLVPESVICNYGFYQQYPASYLLATKNTEGAKNFCARVGKELGESVPDAEAECFRGIGHALPFISGGKGDDPLQMANFAVGICKKISLKKRDYQYCLSGSFNRLGMAEIKKAGGLSVNNEEPLSLCEEFEDEVKVFCYRNFEYTGLSLVDKTDIEVAFKQILDLYKNKSESGISSSVFNLGYDMARKAIAEKSDFSKEAISCSKLPFPYSNDCVDGVSVGIAKNGEPNRQYESIIVFCRNALKKMNVLTAEDCPSFYSRQYLMGIYNSSTAKTACVEFEKNLGISCDQESFKKINWLSL